LSLTVHPSAMAAIEKRLEVVLDRIAHTIVASEKAEWKAGPPRSKPGEHLRAETWNARDSLAVVKPGPLVRKIGYRRNAWYAPWWELKAKKRRLGLAAKLAEFKASGALGQIAGEFGS
jgi:hypothetical protein